MTTTTNKTVIQRLPINLKPGINIEKDVQKLRNTIAAVPGFVDIYWGYYLEDPQKCEILCLWENEAAQDAYPATPQRAKTDYLFWKISREIPRCEYLPLENWSSILASNSGVVEMLSFSSLPSSLPAGTFTPLVEHIRALDGCKGIMSAPTTQYAESGEKEGGKFLIMVGWESVEAHERGKSDEGFKKIPMWIWKKVEMHHVRWVRVGSEEKAKL